MTNEERDIQRKLRVLQHAEKILQINKRGKPRAGSVRIDFSRKAQISEGTRNTTLTSIAGSLRSRGLGGETLFDAISVINDHECDPPLTNAELRRIANSIGRYAPEIEEVFGNMSDVKFEDVEFVVEPQIPRGCLTVIDGMMGLGKSAFTMMFSKMITLGESSDCLKVVQKGRVLVLSAEDDPSRVLGPRLHAAGADLEMIRYQKTPFSLDERGLGLLREELEAYRPIFVIIDPIIAYMSSGADSNSAVDMTHFMVEIDMLAREFDCAILVVRHFRKSQAENSLLQGLGSVAIIARVRSALIIGIDPEDPTKRVVMHHKSNYAKEADPLAYRLVPTENGKYPVVEFAECNIDLTAEEILAPPQKKTGRPDHERERAADLLRDFLSDGSKKSRPVKLHAEAKSFSWSTVSRAKDDLGVIATQGRNSTWRLP